MTKFFEGEEGWEDVESLRNYLAVNDGIPSAAFVNEITVVVGLHRHGDLKNRSLENDSQAVKKGRLALRKTELIYLEGLQ